MQHRYPFQGILHRTERLSGGGNMIVISLDEGGRFELIRNPQCMLIGGIVFQCQTDNDLKQEQRSLENFFKTICGEQGCSYPYDLHYNWEGAQVVNAETASKVKNALEEEMQDYLKMRGRWSKGRPAKSCYYVFCMAGDSHGLNEQTASNLRDDVAAIRYEHMVYRTIENILFYNPKFPDETDIRLSLPTRVIKVTDPGMQSEMLELGYRKLQKGNTYSPDIFHVTDESGFRTCLESALLNSDRNDLVFNLSVQSMNYNTPQFQQMFLYLADTMCSIWQDAIKGMTILEQALPALTECGNKLAYTGNSMLWAYHHADQKWRSCWSDFRHGNWFESLKTADDLRASRAPAEKIYSGIWIPTFEKALEKANNYTALDKAFTRLDQYMLNRSERKQGTALYIMDMLKRNYSRIEDENLRGKLEYQVSKIMTGLYNHNGDHEHARKEYEKCVRAARYVPIEEFLGLQLLYATSMNDAERFEEAEQISAELVSHHELLNEIKSTVYPNNNSVYDSYARALSQHGQSIAFLGKDREAEAEFRKALDLFEKETDDWWTTGNYLLHTLIDQGNKEAYEALAKEYFGTGNLKKKLKKITDGKAGSIPYSIYLLLKGTWVFGGKETEQEIIRECTEKIRKLYESSDLRHPWEMIMKYCAFLWHRYFEDGEDHSQSEVLMEAGREVVRKAPGILKVIGEENEKQYANVIRGKDYTMDSKVRFNYR